MATRNFECDYVEEDTDEDAASSSEDEVDTALRRAQHISRAGKGPGVRNRLSGEDEFEKLMNAELSSIVKAKVERNTELLQGSSDADHIKSQAAPAVAGGSARPREAVKYYDNIYFDSDSEGEYEAEDTSGSSLTVAARPGAPAITHGALDETLARMESGVRRKRHPIPSNDDLFYDPNMDAEDQSWVDKRRSSYKVKAAAVRGSGAKSQTAAGAAAAAGCTTDAVLNCPACMVTLCLDCQRHSVYQNQYRAMFVMNCIVDQSEKLSMANDRPLKSGLKAGSKRKQQRLDTAASTAPTLQAMAGTDQSPAAANSSCSSDTFYAVRCQRCNTQVAMYDTDEVYHFFNIIASHA